MADVQIDPAGISAEATTQVVRPSVWVTALIGYLFYEKDGGQSVQWVKTTDGGQTWSGETNISTDIPGVNKARAFACWYDQWTPGNSGTRIHVLWFDIASGTSQGRLKYNWLDTSDDSMGSQVTVGSLLTWVTAANQYVGITKAIGGNLYAVVTATNSTFFRSVDNGAIWVVRTNPPGVSPLPNLTPGNEADNQDIYYLLYLGGGGSVAIYWYDNSANTWTSTIIDTNGAGYVVTSTLRSTIRLSDNHTIVIVQPINGANSDMRLLDVGSGTTATLKTNVFTNEASHVAAGIMSDSSGNLYAVFRAIAGVSTTAMGYKKSADGGVTWAATVRLDEGNNISAVINPTLSQPSGGARLFGMWRVGSNDIFGNYGTSIALNTMVTYPSYALSRVTSIRHIYRPGSYRLEATLGDVSATAEIAQMEAKAEQKAEPILPAKPLKYIPSQSLLELQSALAEEERQSTESRMKAWQDAQNRRFVPWSVETGRQIQAGFSKIGSSIVNFFKDLINPKPEPPFGGGQ